MRRRGRERGKYLYLHAQPATSAGCTRSFSWKHLVQFVVIVHWSVSLPSSTSISLQRQNCPVCGLFARAISVLKTPEAHQSPQGPFWQSTMYCASCKYRLRGSPYSYEILFLWDPFIALLVRRWRADPLRFRVHRGPGVRVSLCSASTVACSLEAIGRSKEVAYLLQSIPNKLRAPGGGQQALSPLRLLYVSEVSL